MARSLPSLLVGVVLGSSLTSGLAVAAGWRPADEAQALVQRLQSDNAVMLSLAGQVREPGVRSQLQQRAAGMDHDLRALDRTLDQVDATPGRGPRGPGPAVQAPPPHRGGWAPAPGPVACDHGSFQRIVAAVDATPWSQERLALVREAARDRWFTVDQVLVLMDHVTWGSDKVEVAAMLHPHLVDPQDSYRLYGALTFSSDKASLRSRLGA
ncbi:MAG: DUF4476 domain-containing protein [Alphaproteobacteria bacterium]|nr:DUF4476 domain-containing protein [Alphaproteobacteria bacterium]